MPSSAHGGLARKTISRHIRKHKQEGMPLRQAVAAAMSEAGGEEGARAEELQRQGGLEGEEEARRPQAREGGGEQAQMRPLATKEGGKPYPSTAGSGDRLELRAPLRVL